MLRWSHILCCMLLMSCYFENRQEEFSSKPLSVSPKWKGLISMPTFTKFVATARSLSGAADHMLEVCFNLDSL